MKLHKWRRGLKELQKSLNIDLMKCLAQIHEELKNTKNATQGLY